MIFDALLGTAGAKFVFGFVGAVAPEALRLHRIVSASKRDPLPTFDRPYFVISAVNAFIGGWAAVGFGSVNEGNCFMVGAFWPLMLTSVARELRR